MQGYDDYLPAHCGLVQLIVACCGLTSDPRSRRRNKLQCEIRRTAKKIRKKALAKLRRIASLIKKHYKTCKFQYEHAHVDDG
jgi:hypothetical protein